LRLPTERKTAGEVCFDLACKTWFQVDNYRYAGLPVDELVFVVADGGRAEGIWSPGLRGKARKL
jgi:hypothetical protein